MVERQPYKLGGPDMPKVAGSNPAAPTKRRTILIETRGVQEFALHLKCRPVDEVDSAIRELAEEMKRIVRGYKGMGLAAPQVGETIQMFVIATDHLEMVILNPVVVKADKFCLVTEGCLSVPGLTQHVRRPNIIKLRGISLDERPFSVKEHGVYAQALAHEYDHLQGIMFYDRAANHDLPFP